jgi:ribonucleoside-diphosphate reductase alpha chain
MGPSSRPATLRCATRSADTPIGRVIVTVNETDDGAPCEVLVHAGSDLAGFAEAIGRLCSLCLGMPSPLGPTRRLGLIAEELGGIGGSRAPVDLDGARSLPDAVARLLENHLASCPGVPESG